MDDQLMVYNLSSFLATNIEQQPNALNNGQELVSSTEQPSSPTPVATPTSSSGTGNATPAFSYDDLFPALPTNTSTTAPGPAIARVTSSQKTQVSFSNQSLRVRI